MEKIKSIEQLKMQKELLQLQQMIAELRMKKDVHELRKRMSFRRNIVPAIGGIVKVGLGSAMGKQFVLSTASRLAKRLFRKRRKSAKDL